MQIPLPKAKRHRMLLSVLSIVLILLAIDLLWVRIDRYITIGYETTRITSPLKADGYPDYLRALNDAASAGVTDENNAARMLIPLFNPKTFLADRVKEGVYRGLHLPHSDWSASNPASFLTPQQYMESIHVTDAVESPFFREIERTCCRQPWAKADHPYVAAWLERNKSALETLTAAAARPRFYIPYVTTFDDEVLLSMSLPALGDFRALSLAANARAMLRIHDGDFAGARSDLLTSRRFALLVSQSSTMIEYIVACSMDVDTSRSLRGAAMTCNAQQAKVLLAQTDDFPSPGSPLHQIDVERYVVLDALAFASRGGSKAMHQIVSDDPQEEFVQKTVRSVVAPFVPSNYNAALRDVNRYYDRWMSAISAQTFAQRKTEGERIEREVSDRWQVIEPSVFSDRAQRIVYQLLPSFTPVAAREAMVRTERALTRTALALAGYRGEHREYPPTLEALTADWLSIVPLDPFVDAPLHYVKTPTGYRLYSVGPNGQDDDGHTRDQRDAAHPHPDDIAVVVPAPPAAP